MAAANKPGAPAKDLAGIGESNHISQEEDAENHKLMEDLQQQDLEIFRQIVPTTPIEPPPRYSATSPMLPCVIPQATMTLKSSSMHPFIRAYPPELHARSIDERRFLEFLDGFNEAFVTSPVFEAGNLAGFIMSKFHGLLPVQGAGYGLLAASKIGDAAVSYMRSRAYVQAHNEKFFNPLGLTCSILTTEKMTAKVGYPHEKLQLLPRYQDDAEDVGASDQMSSGRGPEAVKRRLEALHGYIQPLNLDVPPSLPSENYFKRMGEWQAERNLKKQEGRLDKRDAKRERKELKHELKGERKQVKLDHKLGVLEQQLHGLEVSRDRQLASQSAQEDPKIRAKIEAEFAKDSAKVEKKLYKKSAKGERKAGKRKGKMIRKQDRGEKREHRIANKVRWIVISDWNPQTPANEVLYEYSSDLYSDVSSSESSLSL